MEESFDDEVLLENSPLSQYLREACPDQDFETIPAVRDKRHHAQASRNIEGQSWIHLHVYIHFLEGLVRQTFALIFPPVADIVQDVNANFLPHYSHLALDSQLLLDSDRQMIQAYCTIKRSRGATHTNSAPEPRVVWLCGHMLGAVAVLCTALAMFVPHLSAGSHTIHGMSDILHIITYPIIVLLSTVYTIHRSRACYAVITLRRLHRECIGCTRQCLEILTRQGTMLKKSIRYIQEVEVISRGFTMVSSCTPIVRLESTASSKYRQCMALREACFTTARAQFNILRDSTLRLVKELPLVAEIDHVSNYLAMVDLESSAPWIKINGDKSELQDSLSELTGCFSLSALKAMNSLFHEQRSEFIRRLILCMCLEARLEPQITVNTMTIWLDTLRSVCSTCSALLNKLQRSYDCHRQRPGLNRSEPVSQGRGGVPPQHRVGNAVRSLRLHLEATLNRVIAAEDTLGENDEHNGSNVLESKNNGMSEMLNNVKRELTASQDCLQEAMASLQIMSNRERLVCKLNPNQDTSGDARQSSSTADNREPILLLPLGDAEIEFDDQIFEAYTDTDPGEGNDDDWSEGISDAEKMRRRREAEETKRMLQELRSVLSVRKAERERMKSERNRVGDAAKNNRDSSVDKLETETDTGTIEVASDINKNQARPGTAKDDNTNQSNISRSNSPQNNVIEPTLRNVNAALPDSPVLTMRDSMHTEQSKPIVQSSNNLDKSALDGKILAAGKDVSDIEANLLRPVTVEENQTALTEAQRQFGLSFIPSLAAQAASMSRQRQCQEETFCGTDDEDSDG